MSEFEISPIPDGTGLKISGELDVLTIPELSRAVSAQSFDGRPFCLDLSELTFLDSSGLRALFAMAKSLNGNGPLVILNPSKPVVRVFEIVGLNETPGIEVRRTEEFAS